MSMLGQQGYFGPEALAIASEAFARAWGFIEYDPTLKNFDHKCLQAELARRILQMVAESERDLVHIANRAIRQIRERMLMASDQRQNAR
jgi:hypothetical protein